MKNDIDFDELDRAVNSLMGGAANVHGTDDTPQPKTLSINPTLKPDENPEYEKLDEVAKRIGSETLVTESAPIEIKNLDISPSEQQTGMTADPLLNEQPLRDTEHATNDIPKPIRGAPPIPRPSGGRFMDVVHPSSDMKAGPVQQIIAQEATKEASEAPSGTAEQETQPAPVSTPEIEVSSPFIPDAKVEKRPLGDPAASSKEPDFSHNDAPEEIVAINSEAATKQESSKSTQEILDASKFAEVSSVDQELREIEAKHAAAEEPSEQADALRAVESVEAVSSNETPQQPGAIFDIKDYHQPLQHPAKRKSGWGVVVTIIIIIVLAAAVGVGAYMLLGLNS